MLSKKDKRLVCSATADFESGNHLLHERTEEEIAMLKELAEALRTPAKKRSKRQKELVEYHKMCLEP